MAAYPAMQKGFRHDEADGLLDRSLTIASTAAKWKMTNDPFRGGNMSYESLATDGLEKLALDSINVRGRYRITRATATQLEVTGVSSRYPGIGVRVYVTDYDIDSSRVDFEGNLTF
jgi:hypothetical protein